MEDRQSRPSILQIA